MAFGHAHEAGGGAGTLNHLLCDSAGEPNCPYDDPAGLADAIEARDAARAAAPMRRHLDHIVQSLDLLPPEPGDFQLEDAFSRSTRRA